MAALGRESFLSGVRTSLVSLPDRERLISKIAAMYGLVKVAKSISAAPSAKGANQDIAAASDIEAALKEKLPLRKEDWDRDYLCFAIPSFRLVTSGVRPETQIHTHMCYSEFSDIIRSIDDMDADVISFEASKPASRNAL